MLIGVAMTAFGSYRLIASFRQIREDIGGKFKKGLRHAH